MPNTLVPAAGEAMPAAIVGRFSGRVLQPYGMPRGMDPRVWRQSVEKRLNDLLDRAMNLITALDLMEADSIDDEDGADAEPWLAWGDRGPQSFGSDFQDCELDGADYEDSGDEHEPSLGWSAALDQNLALMDKGTAADVMFFDGEQDAGDDAEQPDHY